MSYIMLIHNQMDVRKHVFDQADIVKFHLDLNQSHKNHLALPNSPIIRWSLAFVWKA